MEQQEPIGSVVPVALIQSTDWKVTTSFLGYWVVDSIFGGDGFDRIDGQDGNDYLSGGNAIDFIAGGAGRDRIFGDDGNDQLIGELGNDTVYGGLGDDYAAGNPGNDQLYGGDGNDFFVGEAGKDRVFGQEGDDFVAGGDDRVGGRGVGAPGGTDRVADLGPLLRALGTAHADRRRGHAVGADRPAALRARDARLAVRVAVAPHELGHPV